MAVLKTRPTTASVDAFIDAQSEARRADCCKLVRLMSRATGEPPVMWGSSLVGFGSYHYVYDSGRKGDWPLTGFSPRKAEFTLYMMDGFTQRSALLARLGPCRSGASCLYLRSLAAIDLAVLESMIADSVRVMRARHQTIAQSAAPPQRSATRRRRPT